MNIAIIPARGGSKRIPRKNVKLFLGKPIIGYSIEAALESGLFHRVIVSTDDEEIAEVSRQFGAETPFKRPPELSDDLTGTIPVVRHAVEWCIREEHSLKNACCVYATAPFIRPSDLRRGIEELSANVDTAFAFSVTTYAFPIFRSLRVDEGRVGMLWPEHEATRSQDLPECYHDAGQFYWGTADAWLNETSLFCSHSRPVILPRFRVQDIDTAEDWTRAESMYKSLGI